MPGRRDLHPYDSFNKRKWEVLRQVAPTDGTFRTATTWDMARQANTTTRAFAEFLRLLKHAKIIDMRSRGNGVVNVTILNPNPPAVVRIADQTRGGKLRAIKFLNGEADTTVVDVQSASVATFDEEDVLKWLKTWAEEGRKLGLQVKIVVTREQEL